MFASRVIETDHNDVIHDVSFDFYGRRMATCSSDHTVKIWDQRPGEEDWICTADWKRHSGSVWKVTWAHPEFGQVIATCSFDCTAVVWEEEENELSVQGSMSRWIRRASLVDSSSSITDLKFSPHHLGLLLALCYRDGVVRIYEAPDVMSLSYWSVRDVITTSLPTTSCLSWNPSQFHAPLIAVGSDHSESSNPSSANVECFACLDVKWSRVASFACVKESVRDVTFAPNCGRSTHLLAIAGTSTVQLMAMPPIKKRSKNSSELDPDLSSLSPCAKLLHPEAPVCRVEWNVAGTVLSTAGADGKVRLWKSNYRGTWTCITQFKNQQVPSEFSDQEDSSSV